MQWLNLTGAWAMCGVLFILALYMLRRRHEVLEVPSTHLWRMALRTQRVERPIERLRRRLLMWIQLLLLIMLAGALMRPAMLGGEEALEMTLIFDVSASMSAQERGGTRLDSARREAARMVDALPGGSRVSMISAGADVQQIVTCTDNKQQILGAIQALQPQNGRAQLGEAISLAKAVKRELPAMQILLFSDDAQLGDDDEVQRIPIGSPAENRAIISFAGATTLAGGRALAQIANHGKACVLTVECYADDMLCDVRTVDVKEGETIAVSFDIPSESRHLRAKIVESDALERDNERFCTIQTEVRPKIVMAGEGSIFLEKALQLSGAELIKTTGDEAASIADAELFVFDAVLPETLPQRGSMLFVNPPSGALDFALGEMIDGGTLDAHASDLTHGLTLLGAQVRRFRPISGDGETLLLCGGKAAMMHSEIEGRRVAVIGFDLHESNLPMKYDFPVLMHNLLGTLLPNSGIHIEDAHCGQRLALRHSARADAAQVQLPKGTVIDISVPPLPLTNTDEPGIYALRETFGDGSERTSLFAVNLPAEESDLRRVARAAEMKTDAGQVVHYGIELTKYLLMALLLLSVVEWWVSRRED